ncbi:MAG TPA: translation initiation factor IF-3 [Dehalococcoidales bacterium]|nr:translation initiation factor IF-3 [Dehalococcoidales bacterium]
MYSAPINREAIQHIVKHTRINNQIRAPEIRVVGEKGEQLGVMNVPQAIELAKKAGLDLVEVAPTAVPPVCRLLDYGKFKYEQTKKERQARKSQKVVELREIRFRPKIGDHDVDFKVRAIKQFLTDGDKVKVTVMFRGREITHADLGWKLLQKVTQMTDGLGILEKNAVMEGKRMFIILAPSPTAAKAKPKEVKETKEVPQDAKVKNA